MACLVLGEDISSIDLFVLGQLFAFGSIVLHANSIGRLDKIENFAPEHRIRFGNLEYVTDTRGDLVFAGFTASPCTPMGLDVPAPEFSPDPIYGSSSAPQEASSLDGSTLSEDQESPSTAPVMPIEDSTLGLNVQAVFG